MKFYIKSFIIALLAIGLVSCEDFLDVNEDPNNPTSVPVNAQLPAFQIALADVHGGAFSRFNCMLVQQVEGVARQWTSFNQYTGLTPNRFDAAWQNIYENVLNEVKIAKTSATENGFNHYLGVLNIIEAYTLMLATDVWDDMPYTDALQGLTAQNPTYDTQASIYVAIHTLLDNAITLLNGTGGGIVPGSEDVFYGGSITSWMGAAHAVKARALLHQKDYASAATEAAAAFASSADNLSYQYPDANAAGQWYRFNRDREGDIEFHPTMRGIMQGLDDTLRLSVMNQTFKTSHTYLVPDYLEELITYREMQFIIAEADIRANAGGTQAGHDAMANGIRASFNRLGLTQAEADTYIATLPTAGNMTLEGVMTQKYIAMFLQPEAYSDWRRTALPSLTPVSGSNIPVRWHYSSDEYLFNSNSPDETEVNIYTDKVGWNR